MNREEFNQRFERAQEIDVNSSDLQSCEPRKVISRGEFKRGLATAEPISLDVTDSLTEIKTKTASTVPFRPQPGTPFRWIRTVAVMLVVTCLACTCVFYVVRNVFPLSNTTQSPHSETSFTVTSTPQNVNIPNFPSKTATPSLQLKAVPTGSPQNIETPTPTKAIPTITPTREKTVGANLGGIIQLVSYELSRQSYRPGDTLGLTLIWKAEQPLNVSYTVFVHLTSLDDAKPISQHDGPPVGGNYSTDYWQPGERVADSHKLDLPANIAPGQYRLRVGLYSGDGRLSVVNPGQATTADDAILLDPISINQ